MLDLTGNRFKRHSVCTDSIGTANSAHKQCTSMWPDVISLGYWTLTDGAVPGVFVAGILDHLRSLHFVGRSDGHLSDRLKMSSQHVSERWKWTAEDEVLFILGINQAFGGPRPKWSPWGASAKLMSWLPFYYVMRLRNRETRSVGWHHELIVESRKKFELMNTYLLIPIYSWYMFILNVHTICI